MKNFFVLYLLFFSVLASRAQLSFAPSYISKAEKLLASISKDSLPVCQFSFNDTMRMKWERLPGQRLGFKLSHFTASQKIAFHELMRACLSTQGYLTVTGVMFNEDIQQKFEPTLGRNEYWVEVFGNPSFNEYWSWKLEGHHLSLNFTFKGDQMLSNSPFLVSTNPANSVTDTARAGLVLLYKEEEMGRQLVQSFSIDQLKKGYSNRKKTSIVYSEQHKDSVYVPDEGIYYDELNKEQQALVRKLAGEYFNNFNPGEVPAINAFCNKKLRFFYVESMEKGKPHYYRLINESQLIEYENYDNHIHCFWRTDNDFAKKEGINK
ncbi:MAG: DUF3500 domain-containing protein [Chitinophagaceae bacterium]